MEEEKKGRFAGTVDDKKVEIQNFIVNRDYEKADKLLMQYRDQFGWYDDTAAILDAAVGEYYGDRIRVWRAIRQGLVYNCRNYELYIMLGNYYLPENPNQSFLCYENALFYCDISEDKKAIEELLHQIKEHYNICVNKTAIVILSYNLLEYTKLCINSIRMTTPEYAREIVVVDNGSRDGSVEWLREQNDIILVENEENRGFPAGCNQGILASSKETDIFLLNNDTMLPANALFWLRMGLYDKEENGAVGSVTNRAMYQAVRTGVNDVEGLLAFGEKTNVPMKYAYESRLYLIGFALLIKRLVIDKTGLLDERFSPGNSEDLDYGLRIFTAGYQNILCRNSFIIHFGNKSFEKHPENYASVLRRNSAKLNEKWGFDVEYYSRVRGELACLIEESLEKPMHILDIGCGCGALMANIKSSHPNTEVYGIEIIPKIAEIASCMGTVLCGDVEKLDFPWQECFFDYIILGDVLEYLLTPGDLLGKLKKYLKSDGYIIVSTPNVKHYSTVLPLLQKDEFPSGGGNIIDRMPVKRYTGVEIQRLVHCSGYKIDKFGYMTNEKELTEREKAMIDRLVSFMENPSPNSFLAYQYILKASKK